MFIATQKGNAISFLDFLTGITAITVVIFLACRLFILLADDNNANNNLQNVAQCMHLLQFIIMFYIFTLNVISSYCQVLLNSIHELSAVL